ncbi:DUF6686 family protein [Zunongwangia sp.]|uniref:DUF6686 family protein n=1 Tax=Zunongwangia sp. TaxID=1965325 RepID=UPI003AA8ED9C
MEDVDIIHHNDFGIAFKWKDTVFADQNRVQLVFKNMGFYLNSEEVALFSDYIKCAKSRSSECEICSESRNCERKVLLKSPLEKMDFTLNLSELDKICDLVEGTIFKMKLDYYINSVSLN